MIQKVGEVPGIRGIAIRTMAPVLPAMAWATPMGTVTTSPEWPPEPGCVWISRAEPAPAEHHGRAGSYAEQGHADDAWIGPFMVMVITSHFA